MDNFRVRKEKTDERCPSLSLNIGSQIIPALIPKFIVDTGSDYSSISSMWLGLLGYKSDLEYQKNIRKLAENKFDFSLDFPWKSGFVDLELVTPVTRVKVANGSFMYVAGVFIRDILIGNLHIDEFTFEVAVDNHSNPCLLGMDFIDCFRMILDPRDQELTGEIITESTVGQMLQDGTAQWITPQRDKQIITKMDLFGYEDNSLRQ